MSSDRRLNSDCKLSPSQRRVLNTPGVNHIGWDERGRPVVTAMTCVPNQRRTWAVLRDGDPTNVSGEVVR